MVVTPTTGHDAQSREHTRPAHAPTRGAPRRVTAQDLYNLTRCAHRVYLDNNGDPGERARVSPFLELLWQRGLQTEREYLASVAPLPCENLDALSLDDAVVATRALMENGAALIYQGAIRSGHRVGRPDILLKRSDAASRLGKFYYEAIDIKAGRGWEQRNGRRTRFKRHYAFQILFYREILAEVQGRRAPRGRIVNVDMELEEFDPGDFEDDFTQALARTQALVDARETSEPVLTSACHQCPWFPPCLAWVKATRDPSGLFFVGNIKFALKRAGLNTVDDLAHMRVEDYLDAGSRIPGMGEKTLRRIRTRARVLLAGEPEIRPGYTLPRSAREVFFDVEDDPTRALTYLYGVLVVESGGTGEYRAFLARHPDQERCCAEEFWHFLDSQRDAVFYVYSPKERSTLRHMMERYDLDPRVYERYCEQEYDLYSDLVIKYSDWPTHSYGVKQIAQSVGFRWRDPEPGGANSIVWYNDFLADPGREDLMQRILRYNEDDCRAMVAIKSHFEQASGAATTRRDDSGSMRRTRSASR